MITWIPSNKRVLKEGDTNSSLPLLEVEDTRKLQQWKLPVYVFDNIYRAGEFSSFLSVLDAQDILEEKKENQEIQVLNIVGAAAPSQTEHARAYIEYCPKEVLAKTRLFHMDEYLSLAAIEGFSAARLASEKIRREITENPLLRKKYTRDLEDIAVSLALSAFDISFEPHNFTSLMQEDYVKPAERLEKPLMHFAGLADLMRNVLREEKHSYSSANSPENPCVNEICNRYAARIRAIKGGFDLGFYGFGAEGAHVAFIEQENSTLRDLGGLIPVDVKPSQQYEEFKDDPNPLMRYASLDHVPRKAVSWDLRQLIYPGPKRIYVSASGEFKAEAARQFLEGPHFYEKGVPASAFFFHPYTALFLDKAAASKLSPKKHKDRYIYIDMAKN